jgi:hypothetical protein
LNQSRLIDDFLPQLVRQSLTKLRIDDACSVFNVLNPYGFDLWRNAHVTKRITGIQKHADQNDQ